MSGQKVSTAPSFIAGVADDYKDLAHGFPWHVQSDGRVVDSFSRFVFETRPGTRDERDRQSNEDILRSLPVARLGSALPDMLSVMEHLVRTNKALMQPVFEAHGTTDAITDAEVAISRAERLLSHLFPPERHIVPYQSDAREYGTPISSPVPRHDDPFISEWMRDIEEGNIPSPACAGAYLALRDSDRFRVMQEARNTAIRAGRDLHPSEIDRINLLAQTPGVATAITPSCGDFLYGRIPNEDGLYFAVLYDYLGVPEFKETGVTLDRIEDVFGADVRKIVDGDLGRPDPGDLDNYRRIRIDLADYLAQKQTESAPRPKA